MKLSIRTKLIILGICAVISLAGNDYFSLKTGAKVQGINEESRVASGHKVMTEKMNGWRPLLMATYYSVIMRHDSGKISPADMELMKSLTAKTADMTDRLIASHPDYLKMDELNESKQIIADITVITETTLPRMIEAREPYDNFVKLTATMEEKIARLAQIQTDLNDEAARQVSDLSDQVSETLKMANTETYFFFGAAMAVLLPLIVTLVLSIIRPLKQVVNDINRLASGDFSQELKGKDRPDEIGEVARALLKLQDYTNEKSKAEAGQELQRQRKADEDKKIAMNDMANKFEASVKSIVSTVASAATELAQTSEGLVSTMNEASQTVRSASSGANQTTANVQSVASAAEEMTASVKEISGQLQSSNSMVQDSVSRVESADAQAASLIDATEKVKEVVGLISDIAGQINLLALNATIESARAGEAGKGFAVVASEVKNLANQTDQSVKEIEAVIQEMNRASDGIIVSLKGIKSSVQTIAGGSSTIAAAVEEQSATTNEIAKNMQSAAQGTMDVSDNLGTISKSTSDAESSSGQVLEASRELSRQAEKLNTEVESFLHSIRAA